MPNWYILLSNLILPFTWNFYFITSLYQRYQLVVLYDDVIKWKHFPRYWPFVRGIHRSPVKKVDKSCVHLTYGFSCYEVDFCKIICFQYDLLSTLPKWGHLRWRPHWIYENKGKNGRHRVWPFCFITAIRGHGRNFSVNVWICYTWPEIVYKKRLQVWLYSVRRATPPHPKQKVRTRSTNLEWIKFGSSC